MSTIDISIRGTNLNRTINVDRMRDRLNMIRDRLLEEIEAHPEKEAALSSRLDKVDAQLGRLEQFSDRDLEISPKRAMLELERGMKLINDGRNYLRNNYTDGSRQSDQWGLNKWFNHLRDAYEKVDTYG